MKAAIDVIIPTLGTRPRALMRAVESVCVQTDVNAMPLIIVNGNKFDKTLIDKLERKPHIQVYKIPEFGVSNARLEGRKKVRSSFFAFLDDDDELLPEAMSIRLEAMSDPSVEVVATNGYIDTGYERKINYENFCQNPEDPALALVKNPWLSSAGGLYRSDRIGPDALEDLPDYLEITKFAFRLALGYNIVRIDLPTYIVHKGCRGSASGSRKYREALPPVLKSMEAMTERKDLKRLLRIRRSRALHSCSEASLKERSLIHAWNFHLKSLVLDGGWRYLSYTRRLIKMPRRGTQSKPPEVKVTP